MALTVEGVLKLVEAAIAEAGSASNLAQRWGVSGAYLSDVRKGHRAPGPAILERLGLRVRDDVYEKVA